MELIDLLKFSDGATLPIELKDDFYADVTAVFPQPKTWVTLLFKGKSKNLMVTMNAGGVIVVSAQLLDGRKYWALNSPNLLRVEHSSKDKTYLIRLNDSLLGAVPLSRPRPVHVGRTVDLPERTQPEVAAQ